MTNPFQWSDDALHVPPRPRWLWFGTLYYQPPPEETGGIQSQTSISIGAICLSLFLMLAIWWSSRWLVRLMYCIRGTAPISLKRVSLAIACIASAIFLGLAVSTKESTESVIPDVMPNVPPPPGSSRWSYEGFPSLNLTLAQPSNVPRTQVGERRLAQQVSQLFADESRSLESTYLAVFVEPEVELLGNGSSTTYTMKFPVVDVSDERYVRKDSSGATPIASKGIQIAYRFQTLTITFSPADPLQSTRTITIFLHSLYSAIHRPGANLVDNQASRPVVSPPSAASTTAHQSMRSLRLHPSSFNKCIAARRVLRITRATSPSMSHPRCGSSFASFPPPWLHTSLHPRGSPVDRP